MIEITTLGGFELTVDDRVIPLTNRKAQALLIYLASHSDQQEVKEAPCHRVSYKEPL